MYCMQRLVWNKFAAYSENLIDEKHTCVLFQMIAKCFQNTQLKGKNE